MGGSIWKVSIGFYLLLLFQIYNGRGESYLSLRLVGVQGAHKMSFMVARVLHSTQQVQTVVLRAQISLDITHVRSNNTTQDRPKIYPRDLLFSGGKKEWPLGNRAAARTTHQGPYLID